MIAHALKLEWFGEVCGSWKSGSAGQMKSVYGMDDAFGGTNR